MSAHRQARLVIRLQLDTIVVHTTGPLTTIAVAAAGYTRSAGSFLTDGFAVGDELTVSGAALAANNTVAVATNVTAGLLSVDRVRTPAAAGPAITIQAKLPSIRVYEGIEGTALAPLRPYLKERLTPISSRRQTIGPVALVRHLGAVLWDLYVPAGNGTDAADRMADAFITAFWDGLVLSNGTQRVTIRGSSRSAGLLDPQWYHVPLLVQYQADTINAV